MQPHEHIGVRRALHSAICGALVAMQCLHTAYASPAAPTVERTEIAESTESNESNEFAESTESTESTEPNSQGLHPKLEDFAPFILSVPGEAMLIDPPSSSAAPLPAAAHESLSTQDAPLQPTQPAQAAITYELHETQRGSASWYGVRFHRKRTASGELYDMHGFTAAHRTLPFGSRVCVRSLLTGRAVEVRINDRGPFHAHHVIDLSQAAADKLGPKGLGMKQVSLVPMKEEQTLCQDTPMAHNVP